MLDFYLIQDDQPKPDYPEQANLEFVGGLDYKTFENLQNKGVIGSQYNYYSDFRWGTKMIEQQSTNVNLGEFKKDTDLEKLIDILEKAKNKNSGLIAYCD